MKVHTLRIGEREYGEVAAGKNQVQVRPNGEQYQAGDLLMVCEYVNNNLTGLSVGKKITSVRDGGEGVPEGFLLLDLEDCDNTVDSAAVAMNVNREGFDFLSRSKFGDCPHCGKSVTSDKSPERCSECGGPILWSESRFGFCGASDSQASKLMRTIS